MKIKNILGHKNKLLKLKLIKTKIYKKNYTLLNLKIEDIEYRLKKGLQIIYKYHLNSKKITFVGSSLKIKTKIKNILKNTRHNFISEHYWLNGMITNKKLLLNKSLKKNSFNTISVLKTNLIVILDKLTSDTILKESYHTKTPVIFLGKDLNAFNTWYSYKIAGSFSFNEKSIRDNFFLTLLKATIKKSKWAIKKYNYLKRKYFKFQKYKRRTNFKNRPKRNNSRTTHRQNKRNY